MLSVIVGARTIEQLDDNLAATEITLSDEELARLDLVSALPPEYPGWMLERQGADRRQFQTGSVAQRSSAPAAHFDMPGRDVRA